MQLAAAEAAEDDPAFAPDVVKPAAAALFTEIQGPGTRAIAQRLQPPRRARAAGRVGAAPRRLPAPRLAQPRPADRRPRPSSTWASRNRGGDDADRVVVRIEAKLRDYVVDSSGRHIKSEGQLTETAPPARVLDAAPARQPLDPCLDRAGRGGIARARRRDRRNAMGRRAGDARRGAGRGRHGRRGPAKARRSPRSRIFSSTARPRRGARPEPRRRPLRSRRPRGRGAPSGGGLGGSRRRQRRGAQRDRTSGGGQGPAASRRLERRHAAGRARPARQADPDRRARCGRRRLRR